MIRRPQDVIALLVHRARRRGQMCEQMRPFQKGHQPAQRCIGIIGGDENIAHAFTDVMARQLFVVAQHFKQRIFDFDHLVHVFDRGAAKLQNELEGRHASGRKTRDAASLPRGVRRSSGRVIAGRFRR